MRVADLLNEVRQPKAHEHACLVTDCDDFIERKLWLTEAHSMFALRRKNGRLFTDVPLMDVD